jgi:D-3-phosphoglycerate dehydrogenase / 2-oxoglutarate reductase
MRITILDDYFDTVRTLPCFARLDGHDVTLWNDHLQDADALAERLKDTEVLCLIRERTKIQAPLLDKLTNLRLISQRSVYPHIDVAACTRNGVLLCSDQRAETPSYAAAELTFALALAAARDIPQQMNSLKAGSWQCGVGTTLRGKVYGVHGYGRIGAEVARYAKAFGMDVVAWSQNLTEEKAAKGGAKLVSKDELLKTSDFVSIHLVLSERTRGLLGAADLAKMKKTAILVNTSRGPIVDEAALIDALKKGTIAHAGLDVYDKEPVQKGHPLTKLENVTLVPHLGYVVEDSYRHFYAGTIEDIEAWLDGKPINVINPDALKKAA